jgi:hypothetical protein
MKFTKETPWQDYAKALNLPHERRKLLDKHKLPLRTIFGKWEAFPWDLLEKYTPEQLKQLHPEVFL